jgi:hypothetical protein
MVSNADLLDAERQMGVPICGNPRAHRPGAKPATMRVCVLFAHTMYAAGRSEEVCRALEHPGRTGPRHVVAATRQADIHDQFKTISAILKQRKATEQFPFDRRFSWSE